jgi:hypothetical protein
VLGFHVTKEGAVVDSTVQSWNCRVLKVNEFKQHANASACRDFWLFVDEFVKLRRPQ